MRGRFRMLLLAGAVIVAFVGGLLGTMAATSWLSAAHAPRPLGAPRFVDETTSSGLAHTYSGGFDFAVGGGGVAADPRLWQLPAPAVQRTAPPLLRQPARPPRWARRLRKADSAGTRLVRALDALQRLGPIRSPRPADKQRS